MYTTLIVDDEFHSRQSLKNLIEQYDIIGQIMEAQNAAEALSLINDHNPDLIFLDIDMPGKNGIDFLKEIRTSGFNQQVVFVTAHANYAIEAIKCASFDYLLKPVNPNEFHEMMQRLLKKKMNGDSFHEKFEKFLNANEHQTIKIKTKNGLHVLRTNDIVFLQSDSNYTKLIDQNGASIMISKTLGKMQEMLPACQFIRIGRSHIINKNFIIGTDHLSKQIKLLVADKPLNLEISLNDLRKLEKQL